MGAIVDRTRERLGTSDTAIIAMRRLMLQEIRALAQAREPFAAQHGDVYWVRSASLVLESRCRIRRRRAGSDEGRGLGETRKPRYFTWTWCRRAKCSTPSKRRETVLAAIERPPRRSRILIKPRPVSWWQTRQPEDLIVIDFNGKRVDGPRANEARFGNGRFTRKSMRRGRMCDVCCMRTRGLDAHGCA